MIRWVLIVFSIGWAVLASLWALAERDWRAQELAATQARTGELLAACEAVEEAGRRVEEAGERVFELQAKVSLAARRVSIASQNAAREGMRAARYAERYCGGPL